MEHATEKTEKYGYHHYKHLQKREYDFVRLSTRVRQLPSPSSTSLPSFLPHNHPGYNHKRNTNIIFTFKK